jgi:hypothetical protein
MSPLTKLPREITPDLFNSVPGYMSWRQALRHLYVPTVEDWIKGNTAPTVGASTVESDVTATPADQSWFRPGTNTPNDPVSDPL